MPKIKTIASQRRQYRDELLDSLVRLISSMPITRIEKIVEFAINEASDLTKEIDKSVEEFDEVLKRLPDPE